VTSRFSFSMPGRRGPGDPWFRIGTLEVTTTVLVVILGVLAMFMWAASPSSIEPLILYPDKVRQGQVWRIVSWPLYNPPDFWTAVTLFFFWYIGRQVEEFMGRARFTWLIFLLALIPGLVAVGLSAPQASLAFVELAVFVVFCCEYPHARFLFGIPAWVLAVVFVGIQVLQLTGARAGASMIFLFSVLATGMLTTKAFGHAAEVSWIPRIPIGASRPPGARRAPKQRRRKPTGPTVVSGPWVGAIQQPLEQREIDALLDKIAKSGLDSLTPHERRRLDEVSRRWRDERDG
jgi:membrane associated rhomboid family serine protease